MIERDVPYEELKRVVKRVLTRCRRTDDGCLLHSIKNAQLRVVLAPGVYRTVSATRAIYLVCHVVPAADDEQVVRSCGVLRCLEPEHLVKNKIGEFHPVWRERAIEATRRATRVRRKYTDKQEAHLRRLVAGGVKIYVAARRAGINRVTAYQIIAGRSAPGGRYLKRGTWSVNQCSACGGDGHRRNHKTCPRHPEHALEQQL